MKAPAQDRYALSGDRYLPYILVSPVLIWLGAALIYPLVSAIGLSVRDVLALMDLLDVNLVGADVVEFNPRQDIGGLTAGVAAKIVKELLAKWQTA